MSTDSAVIPKQIPGDKVAALRGKRVAVLLYSFYPSDTRVHRACEALVQAGMEVELLCLREFPHEPLQETIDGVHVFRLPRTHSRGSAFNYIWNYGRFLASAFWFVVRRGWVKKYDLVHVHNMPDVLVFSSLPAKIRGARVILDLHDPTPELMITIFDLNEKQFIVRAFKLLEKWSIGFSHLVLTPNIAFKDLFASRSCRPEKVQIVMNSPQHEIFNPDRFPPESDGRKQDGEFRLMHHGSILHRHGLDLLIEAVVQVRVKIPGIRLDIYGPATPFLEVLLELAKRHNATDIVRYQGNKTPNEIAEAIRQCDLGIVPNRRSVFTEINFPTRLFEYLAMQRPVIAPSTKGIRDYFNKDQIVMFEPDNVADLSAKILWVWEHPKEVRMIVENGIKVYRQNLWAEEKKHFIDLVSAQVIRA